jgi:hypothetical protein
MINCMIAEILSFGTMMNAFTTGSRISAITLRVRQMRRIIHLTRSPFVFCTS